MAHAWTAGRAAARVLALAATLLAAAAGATLLLHAHDVAGAPAAALAGGGGLLLLAGTAAGIVLGAPRRLAATPPAALQEALRESEEKFAAAFHNSPISMALTATDNGTYRDVNAAFERDTGFTRDQVVGRNALELDIFADCADRDRLVADLTRLGKVYSWPCVFRRKDGSLMHTLVCSSPASIAGKRYYLSAIMDITDRRVLEEQLRQAQKMEAVGVLAGGIAHDFNNLLQALLSSTQAALLRSTEPGLDAALAEIQSLARRGAGLTRQLLLFSRQAPARREPVDLAAVVEEHGAMLRRLLPETIDLTLARADGPIPVDADAGQLAQVLTNLVLNARDAVPAGGRVRIATTRRDAWAVLEVSDSGVGIPPELRERIFDPFFTTKEHGKGTGLGLAVVWGIARDHGGSVEVDSAPGRGATFRILLPLGKALAGSPVTPAEAPALPAGRGERVLVVEDEEGARNGLCDLLAALGYGVTAVGSGEEAARLPEGRPFDLLLTDYLLPGATGLEVAGRLTERWPGLEVVVMSGYAPDDVARDLFASGTIHFLQKPFDMATLARALNAALGDGDERKR